MQEILVMILQLIGLCAAAVTVGYVSTAIICYIRGVIRGDKNE